MSSPCLELQAPLKGGKAGEPSIDVGFVQSVMEYMQYATHIEGGQVLQLDLVDVDLMASLNDLIRMNKSRGKDLQFQVRSHSIPKYVSADPCIFKHVLQPLLNFVIAYAPESSKVDVCVFQAVNYFTFKLEFSIKADMSSDAVFKNFNQYYANSSELEGFASIGLGLYIASNLIQAMGGSLEYYSEAGDAVFQFNVPLKAVPSAPNEITPRGEMRWSSIAESAVAAVHIVEDVRPGTGSTDATGVTSLDDVEFTMSPADMELTKRMKEMMLEKVSGGEIASLSEGFVEAARKSCQNHDFLGLSKGRQLRILVVDDSAICTSMLCKALQKVGYATDSANNGKEALKLLSITPCVFDAVIMDVVMPIMNGIAATQAIRKDLKLLTLPIIVLTADVSDDTRRDAIAAGATDFMLKPAYTKSIIKLLHSRGLIAKVPDDP